jgi:hypothetical protein
MAERGGKGEPRLHGIYFICSCEEDLGLGRWRSCLVAWWFEFWILEERKANWHAASRAVIATTVQNRKSGTDFTLRFRVGDLVSLVV